MKIKNKLTYLFALIVGTLMLVFSVSIYFFYSQYREIEFMSRLKVRALSTAELIAEVEELNPELIQQIESKTVALLYDEHMHIFFNTTFMGPLNCL